MSGTEQQTPVQIIGAKLFGAIDVLGIVRSSIPGSVVISHVHRVSIVKDELGQQLVNIDLFFNFSQKGLEERLTLTLDNSVMYNPLTGLEEQFNKILTGIVMAQQATPKPAQP